MRVAIFGAGSLGIILGAYLTKNGQAVDLFHRNPEQVKALNENGAKVVGCVEMTVPVKAYLSSEMEGEYDMIFLLTKQTENAKTALFLKDHLSKNGVVVTLQNGIPEVLLGEILGEEHVLGATVAWGATLQGNGVSKLTSGEDTFTFSLGSLTNQNHPMLPIVKEILEKMGKVEVEENFIGARFSKLLVNSAFSGLSAALGVTFGEVAKNHQTRKYVQCLIKECIDVAKANGIQIEPIQGKDVVKLLDYKTPFKKWLAYQIIPIAMKKHKNLRASMLQDLERGKKCEIEAINGVIVHYAKKARLTALYNENLIAVVKRIEQGELKPSMDNMVYLEMVK